MRMEVSRGDLGYSDMLGCSDNLCFKSSKPQGLKWGRKQIIAQLWLCLLNNMDPGECFSGYNLKDAGRKQNFGHAKNM